jgi:hypothetical protein
MSYLYFVQKLKLIPNLQRFAYTNLKFICPGPALPKAFLMNGPSFGCELFPCNLICVGMTVVRKKSAGLAGAACACGLEYLRIGPGPDTALGKKRFKAEREKRFTSLAVFCFHTPAGSRSSLSSLFRYTLIYSLPWKQCA